MQKSGHPVTFRFYDREPLSREELLRLVGDRPVELFLNPRSPAYKQQGLAGKKISKAEFVRRVMQDSNLLKRPLVVHGRRFIFGLDPAAYQEL